MCQIKKNIKLGEGTETGLEEYISAQIIAIQNKLQDKKWACVHYLPSGERQIVVEGIIPNIYNIYKIQKSIMLCSNKLNYFLGYREILNYVNIIHPGHIK